MGHVNNDLSCLCLAYHSSLRHMNNHILAIGSMTTALAARLAIARKIFTDMTKVIQCIYSGIHFKYQITTTAAVSAIRTTCSYIQFSSETHMTVSAFSGSYRYLRTISKHHILLLFKLLPLSRKPNGSFLHIP